MGQRGVSLTGPARRDASRKAYQMAIRRVTFTEIGQALDISRQLVANLVAEEQERQWSDRDTAELEAEKKRAIHTYEEVIRGAWKRLGKIHDNSLNVSGLYNVIISAQSKIDEITGARAPTKSDNRHEHNHTVDYSNFSTEELREKVAELRILRESGGSRASAFPSRN